MLFIEDFKIDNTYQYNNNYSATVVVLILYLIVSLTLFLRSVFSLIKLLIYVKRKSHTAHGHLKLIDMPGTSPFSFFNYVFVDKNKTELSNNSYILKHEEIHAQQLHTVDILLIELISALLWFNPFVFFYKKSIKANHEYLADSVVLQKTGNLSDYFQTILVNTFRSNKLLLVNHLAYSLTKKRIKMMSKINKKTKQSFKALFSVIILLGVSLLFISNKPIEKLRLESLLNTDIIPASNVPDISPIKIDKIEKITHFGVRTHPILNVKRMHVGIDLKAETGTDVYATAGGIVVKVQRSRGYGNVIKIQHDNEYLTVYAHLKSFNVKVNQKVSKGDVIGYVGNTGLSTAPHLHYEVRKNEEPINPIDYIPELNK